MGAWDFASKPEDDGTVVMTTTLAEDDSNGNISGSVKFRGTTYAVTGQWAAKGSVTGRKASVFWFGGTSPDDAPTFLAAAGDVDLSVKPATMDIAVTTASSTDGDDYGYNGRLYNTDSSNNDDDGWDE